MKFITTHTCKIIDGGHTRALSLSLSLSFLSPFDILIKIKSSISSGKFKGGWRDLLARPHNNNNHHAMMYLSISTAFSPMVGLQKFSTGEVWVPVSVSMP